MAQILMKERSSMIEKRCMQGGDSTQLTEDECKTRGGTYAKPNPVSVQTNTNARTGEASRERTRSQPVGTRVVQIGTGSAEFSWV